MESAWPRGAYLVNDDEEKSIDEDGPNEDVAKDARHQMMGMGNHQCAVPVNGNKGPRQRTGDHRGVDEARVGIMTEVERGKVEKVQQQDDLSPVKVRSDKEHDEGKVEEVVEDEVAADAGSGIDNVGIAREEVPDVAGLENEENDPVEKSLAI